MIESRGELSISPPRGAANVSENPWANSLVFAEKNLETERVLSGNSLRMEVCTIPSGTEVAGRNLRSLEGLDTWSCPGIFCWILSSQTQSRGNPPLPWARPVSNIHREHYLLIIIFGWGGMVTYFKPSEQLCVGEPQGCTNSAWAQGRGCFGFAFLQCMSVLKCVFLKNSHLG